MLAYANMLACMASACDVVADVAEGDAADAAAGQPACRGADAAAEYWG